MDEIVLQTILGTDKKNPSLSLLREEGTNRIHIYYGSSHLECIQDDPDHINYRTAAGRLYNAGLNRKVLTQTFCVDRRTLQKWGKALLLEDAEDAVRILTGKRHSKLTPEIIQFARVRFFGIYPGKRNGYSKQIRAEIKETFDVEVCSETLRPYFRKWKFKLEKESTHEAKELVNLLDVTKDVSHDTCDDANHPNVVPGPPEQGLQELGESPIRKCDVSSGRFIRHAGVCIFATFLAEIGKYLRPQGAMLKQWLCMIFLEVVNIEQSKFLDFHSLSHLLGETIRRPLLQRQQLDELANEATFHHLFKLNGKLCGVDQCSDFYYDPHSKQYTGTHKILKGWCGSIGHADKVLHSDFIHSSQGCPLYMAHVDNYYDLRERYSVVIAEFRKCMNIDSSKCITMIIDRGIYSKEQLELIALDPSLELITWEKNFKPDDTIWKNHESSHFCMKRYRNNSRDVRHYLFQYVDIPWQKNSKIRQLVVKATNPNGRTIELAILTTDTQRNATEIITIIFRRWIQENDFKYLQKHYGINQIISYDTIDYKELAETLTDKKVTSGTYKALQYDKAQQEKRLKDLLLKKHLREKNIALANKRLKDVEGAIKALEEKQLDGNDPEKISELKKERRTLKAQLGRWNRTDYDEKISLNHNALEKTKELLKTTKEHDSKLETLIDQGYSALDTRKKKLMDILKIYARNIFYHMFENFKVAYDNYRDDHDYFRNLSHADGIIEEKNGEVEVKLYPSAYLEPKIRKIMEEFLYDISNKNMIMPDGSNRKMTLCLVTDETFQLANTNPDI